LAIDRAIIVAPNAFVNVRLRMLVAFLFVRLSCFFVTSTNSIMRIIINLNNSKSPGCDNIGPSLIKDVSTVILDPLVYIPQSAW